MDFKKLTSYTFFMGKGLNFDRLRLWLAYLYFNVTDEESFNEVKKYILPMSPNFLSPFAEDEEGDSGATFIQFFIDKVEKLTQDSMLNGINQVRKVADISVRFSGRNAENWAYVFQHLTKRPIAHILFEEICNGTILEATHDVEPIVLEYSGSSPIVGFDTGFSTEFVEEFTITEDVLGEVILAPGQVRG